MPADVSHDDMYQTPGLSDLNVRLRGVPPDMRMVIYRGVTKDWRTPIIEMPLAEAKFFAKQILKAIAEAPDNWMLPEGKPERMG